MKATVDGREHAKAASFPRRQIRCAGQIDLKCPNQEDYNGGQNGWQRHIQ